MKITNRPLWNYDETRIIERWIVITGNDWWFYFILCNRGVHGYLKVFKRNYSWGFFLREHWIWFSRSGFKDGDEMDGEE